MSSSSKDVDKSGEKKRGRPVVKIPRNPISPLKGTVSRTLTSWLSADNSGDNLLPVTKMQRIPIPPIVKGSISISRTNMSSTTTAVKSGEKKDRDVTQIPRVAASLIKGSISRGAPSTAMTENSGEMKDRLVSKPQRTTISPIRGNSSRSQSLPSRPSLSTRTSVHNRLGPGGGNRGHRNGNKGKGRLSSSARQNKPTWHGQSDASKAFAPLLQKYGSGSPISLQDRGGSWKSIGDTPEISKASPEKKIVTDEDFKKFRQKWEADQLKEGIQKSSPGGEERKIEQVLRAGSGGSGIPLVGPVVPVTTNTTAKTSPSISSNPEGRVVRVNIDDDSSVVDPRLRAKDMTKLKKTDDVKKNEQRNWNLQTQKFPPGKPAVVIPEPPKMRVGIHPAPWEMEYPFHASATPHLKKYAENAKVQAESTFGWYQVHDSFLNPILPVLPRLKKPDKIDIVDNDTKSKSGTDAAPTTAIATNTGISESPEAEANFLSVLPGFKYSSLGVSRPLIEAAEGVTSSSEESSSSSSSDED